MRELTAREVVDLFRRACEKINPNHQNVTANAVEAMCDAMDAHMDEEARRRGKGAG